MKRKNKHQPTYTHERTSFAGISERLALASLAFSKTWVSSRGYYMHTARLISKRAGEGWETNIVWSDNLDHINVKDNPYTRRYAAECIEGARAAWFDAQHPSKELRAIVANVAAKKAA